LPAKLYEYALRRIGLPARPEDPIELTPQNLADLLSVTRVTVINWMRSGKLVPSRINPDTGETFFHLEDVFAVVREAIRANRRIALASIAVLARSLEDSK